MKLPEKEIKLRRRNKLVHGVGINDANYNVYRYEYINGKSVCVWKCPFYITWVSMLGRCYYEKYQRNQPTYKDCSVCDEWLYFSNFKRWMEQQDWEGKQLDKDLLVEGNKIYSPEYCIFVHQTVNNFINDHGNASGDYMLGVSWHKQHQKLISRCSNPFTGKREHLGLFDNELDAHLAWKKRKHELACQLADSEHVTDERLANVLRNKYK